MDERTPSTVSPDHAGPDRAMTLVVDEPDLDQLALRRVFGAAPAPVAAVSALVEDRPVGMAVASFVPVSLAPPLVSACFASTSATWRVLRAAPQVGISVLSAEQHVLGRQLASASGQRFDRVIYTASPTGAICIAGSAAYFECELEAEVPGGDHTVALFRVHRVSHDEIEPLVFHRSRFRSLAG